VARKKGLLAELQHQAQLAQRRREQAVNEAYRRQVAAQKEAERARREAEREQARLAQHAKKSESERKAADRDAKRLQDEAIAAEVESRNLALANTYAEIDGLLAATLEVDDFVDLEQLRQAVEHPPFGRPDLDWPAPPPPPPVLPAEPQYLEPPLSRGLFGGKKKHEAAVAEARDAHQALRLSWQEEVDRLQAEHRRELERYEDSERGRLLRLEQARREYERECETREHEVLQANAALDELISGLNYGVEAAVQDYVGIVLASSTYPESFPVSHDYTFDASTGELTVTVSIPSPTDAPHLKEFRYVKAKGEINETALPLKQQKDRYASAVAQVALRSVHEVFEADRAGHIKTMSVTVGTEAVDPATGLSRFVPLAAVAADRATFTSFDLANIVPAATLAHLGGVVSKSPFDLIPIDVSKAVGGRK